MPPGYFMQGPTPNIHVELTTPPQKPSNGWLWLVACLVCFGFGMLAGYLCCWLPLLPAAS